MPPGEPYIPHHTIAELNKNRQDYLVCDVLMTPAQLDHFIANMPDGSGRKKRKAAFDSEYPNDIWSGPIPYTFDSSLSKKACFDYSFLYISLINYQCFANRCCRNHCHQSSDCILSNKHFVAICSEWHRNKFDNIREWRYR